LAIKSQFSEKPYGKSQGKQFDCQRNFLWLKFYILRNFTYFDDN
jgi:hypothetical protein